MSSWLLLHNKELQQKFVGLFGLSLSLGVYRFVFPFHVVAVGGSATLISMASVLFSIGQLVSFLLISQLITSTPNRLLLGGGCILLLTGLSSIVTNPVLLIGTRFLDGVGYGVIFLSIISFALRFNNHEGEALGNLFAAVLSGLAVGQGVAGVTWAVFTELFFSPIQSIQLILILMFSVSLIMLLLLYLTQLSTQEQSTKAAAPWKWKHFHLRQGVRTFVLFPSILVLTGIYLLYDFAHGIYTPNLSILLSQRGLTELGIGLAYFVGDVTWGLSQIITGRLVDRIGTSIPLVFSLLVKGIVVFFYSEIGIIFLLFLVLFLAGLAEGFLEPARNKALLEVEAIQGYTHSHTHLDVGFSGSGSIVLGAHKHEHEHQMQQDSVISLLQSIGIASFGFGSLFGSIVLFQGFSLTTVTHLGGYSLLIASLLAILFAYLRKRRKK